MLVWGGFFFLFRLTLYLLSSLGWRLGLQSVTGCVSSLFFLGLFYRSASLYHPQRRAILHLKVQFRSLSQVIVSIYYNRAPQGHVQAQGKGQEQAGQQTSLLRPRTPEVEAVPAALGSHGHRLPGCDHAIFLLRK